MGIDQLLGSFAYLARDDVGLAIVGGGMLDDELRHLGCGTSGWTTA